MPRRDRDLTKTYSRNQFVAKLRRFADALEAGRPFTIQVAGERLRVPADAAFDVEHERAGSEEELEFQVSWTHEPGPAIGSGRKDARAPKRKRPGRPRG